MASFIEIPIARLGSDVLQALLEEFASRDGTDYGEVETSLGERVAQLHRQLEDRSLALLYDADSEHWDLRLFSNCGSLQIYAEGWDCWIIW